MRVLGMRVACVFILLGVGDSVLQGYRDCWAGESVGRGNLRMRGICAVIVEGRSGGIMNQESGERSLGKRVLRRALVVVGIGAAMVIAGVSAFFSVYHEPPAPMGTGTAPGAATMAATAPSAGAVTEARVNPPMVYRAVVVDPEGKPAGGVSFRVYHVGAMSPTLAVESQGRTGADGTLEVGPYMREGMGGTNRVVMVDAPGYGWAWWNVGAGNSFLPHGRTRIGLLRAAPVAGVVANAKDEPVANAVVEADVQTLNDNSYGDAQFTEQNGHSSVTDAHGAFHFERVPAGTLLQIYVRHPDYARYSTRIASPNRFYPVPAGMTDVGIKLQPAAGVHAQLIQDGKPLARAGVWMEAFDHSHI